MVLKFCNLIIFLSLLVCFSLRAGFVRAMPTYFNSPVCGNRVAAMGGAYTAVSDDAASLCYNPAGLSYASATKGTDSSTSYVQASKRIYGVASDGSAYTFRASGVSGYIGSYTLEPLLIGRIPVAIVVDVPQIADRHQSIEFGALSTGIESGNQHLTSNEQTKNLYFGSAHKFSWGSAGMAFQFRDYILKTTQGVSAILRDQNGSLQMIQVSQHRRSEVIEALINFGVMMPLESLSTNIGLSMTLGKPVKQFLSGEHNIVTANISPMAEPDSYKSDALTRTRISVESNSIRKSHMNARLGIATKIDKKLLVSADLSRVVPEEYIGPMSYEGIQPVNNGSFGLEWLVRDHAKLSFGAYTNLDTQRPLQYNDVTHGSGEHLDFYGVTAGVNIEDGTSIYGAGVNWQQGQGNVLGSSVNNRVQYSKQIATEIQFSINLSARIP